MLRKRLGSGSAADVYLAEHALLPGRLAVVKRFRGARAGEALRREAACVAALASPFVVRLAGGDLSADPPYLTYEHVPGEALRTRLERGRTLTPAAGVRLLLEVLAGLAHAHERGFVHGDVKPENVLMSDEGRAVLLDFGLGSATRFRCEDAEDRLVLSVSDTATLGALEGTLPYLAPERLRRSPPAPAGDVYACGVLIFEVLAGRLPGPGDTLAQACPAAPQALDVFLARSYCHVDRRFVDARQALEWLRGALDAPGPEQPEPAATASSEGRIERLAERARLGELPPERLRLAAYLGDREATAALGRDAPPAQHPLDPTDVGRWVEALGRARLRPGTSGGSFVAWSREAYTRAAIAAARTLLPFVEPAHADRCRRAIDEHEAWLRCPCDPCRARALRAAADVSPLKPARPPLDPMAARIAVRRLARVLGAVESVDRAASDVARLAAIVVSPATVVAKVREALVPWALEASAPP